MIKREKIYNLYWYFAAERQNIFYKKLNGEEADLIILNSTGDNDTRYI